jgi:tetratricopeptide (TPR) repeat protein
MQTILKTPLIAALSALLFTALPPPAQAASTVYGGGMAEACFKAARDGRSDIGALRECDAALLNGDLDARNYDATLVNRGVVHLQRREGPMALADFDAAIAARPDLGEAHVNRGAALILTGDFGGAITAIDRGLALGSEDPQEAYFNRAVAHEMLDNLPAALADYRRASELKPDWELPRTELARFTVRTR